MKQFMIAMAALSLASCAMHAIPTFQEPDKRLVDLQKEKDRLNRATDPVRRTKSQIKISEILLGLTSDAIRTGDLDGMQQRLDAYVAAIQDAHKTMMKTGRDAHKKPGGFRDLEIALRRHVNRLKDIGDALTFEERDPVQKARDEAARIRDELLKALFGGPNVTPI
jgi:hypothetical protein